jgi:hypothetical protein
VRTSVILTLVASSAACQLLATGPIGAGDCFGNVPYAFVGWTTKRDLGIAPEDGRIYALVTAGEVRLASGPLAADGSHEVVIGRGVCYTDETRTVISQESLGPARQIRVGPGQAEPPVP